MRELSGGNQQKVLLARALSNEGRLVVLFEPTQGVDVGVKADIYAQLSDLAARGLGVLMYSSDEDELSLVSDRVLVLGKGRVVAEFTSREHLARRHRRSDGWLLGRGSPAGAGARGQDGNHVTQV